MRARLVVEAGQAYPAMLDLKAGQVVKLGRNRGNTVVLKDQHASRWHAEITPDEGNWVLRDCGTTNGTRLDSTRISRATPLEDGQEIRIGDTCFRFRIDQGEEGTAEMPALQETPAETPAVPVSEPDLCVSDTNTTALQPDELTVLFTFMDGSLREDTPRGLVALALKTVQEQTGASVAGFLSLDEEDPLPKMVVPDLVRVDTHLSKQLTQRVQRGGRTVWLAGDGQGEPQTESLLCYRDALCVPVRGLAAAQGALHVYKAGGMFAERQVRFCEVLAGYLSKSLSVLRSRRALEADNSRLRIHVSGFDSNLVGDSAPMRQLRQQLGKLAERPKVVLICGESGAGKELVSLALHRQSSRCEGPLVAVNCAAIPASLLESELFGHVKGAFTTALEDHPGYFQQADTGTLFLDEIGELSEECQAKLLRVLETGTVRPVGSRKEVKVDVRILAATNRDLRQQCLEGSFRKDLFFRLGVEVRVPPLRERREDIPALVQHFLSKLAVEFRRACRPTPAAMERLQEYHWPGNVRQLRSVLEHAVAMGDGDTIDADDLHLFTESLSLSEAPSLNLKELEAWAIRQALKRTQGTITQAARLLGIHRDTLAAKMKDYKIEKSGEA
jgi:Nif-specific regulatory protein